MAYTPINLYGQGSQGMGGDPLSNLIGEEMGGTQLGQQGFQNFLSQQGMQQQAQLAQQELGAQREGRMFQMAGDLFSAENAAREAEKARQFAANESMLDRQAREAENNAMRQFQMGMFQKEQMLQLELAKIDAEIEDAIANELTTQLPALQAKRAALSKDRSENAAKLAAAQAAEGQSREGLARITGNMKQQLAKQINASEQAISLADNFRKQFAADFLESSAEASSKALAGLSGMQGAISSSNVVSFLIAKGLTEEQAKAAVGQLRGLEFINLKPGATVFGGLDPSVTASAGFDAGPVDADTKNKIINSRIADTVVKQAGSMQLRNFNEQALREALALSLSGEGAGDRAVFAEKLRASGVDPLTFKTLTGGAAQLFSVGSEAHTDLNARAAALAKVDGGQGSLLSRALQAEREMMSLTAKQLTKLSNFTDVADMSTLKDGLAAIDALMATGEISGLTQSSLERALPEEAPASLGELARLIQSGKASAADIRKYTLSQGDLAQQESDIGSEMEMLRTLIPYAGRGIRRKGLGRMEGLVRGR